MEHTRTGELTVNAPAKLSSYRVNGGTANVTGVSHSALEDVGEGDSGHSFVRDAAGLGTTSKDCPFRGRVLKPKDQLVVALGDLLLPNVLKRLIAKQSVVGNGYGKEEACIVVEKLSMFLRRRAKTGVNFHDQ